METLLMSANERRRLEVFGRVREGRMTLVEASGLLKLSYRQTKRSWGRFQEEAHRGLVHRGRGKPSNRQAAAGLKERVLARYREQYADYGPTLAAECLASEDGVQLSVTTLRVFIGEVELRWSAAHRGERTSPRRSSVGSPTGSSQGQKPRANHP